MASPRATVSLLKCLSPRRVQHVSNLGLGVSPKCSTRNSSLEITTKNHGTTLPIFNIDTPCRKKMVNTGLLDERRIVLGNGAFGTVYKANYKGQAVAAKIINNKKSRDSLTSVERDAAFLRHSNIVKILKVDGGKALTVITMELCGNSLQNILDVDILPPKQRIHIWRSLAEALKYCHTMGVVHADVKPKNVLMSMDNQPKLADFGSAVFIREPQIISIFHGTPGYAAPEVVRNNMPSPLSDVYSLGTLAWQMLSREPPFSGLHKHTILYLTGKGITPSDYDLDDECRGKYRDLYRKSWSIRPEDRPSLVEVITDLEKLETESLGAK